MISTFHKNYPEKPTKMLSSIDFALPMSKLTAKLVTKLINVAKKNRGRPAKASIKQIREM